MIRKIIDERLTNKAHGKSNDAIDVLLRDIHDRSEVDQCLPLDVIAGNIIEMMVPGEDSVPMVMTLAVKYLSDNPVALKQLVVSLSSTHFLILLRCIVWLSVINDGDNE